MNTDTDPAESVSTRRFSWWRWTELVLAVAILWVAWQAYGHHAVTYVNDIREARAARLANLPQGGAVVVHSRNPLLALPYHWRNYWSDAPLLLPDITPIIGEDPTLDGQYPNMEAWLIDTVTQPGRTLLRLNTATANMGDGPLHVVGGTLTDEGKQVVYQRIWRADDTFIDREAGHFVYHADHAHIHFDHYAQYVLRLRDADGHIVAGGRKVGFCLTDVLPTDNALIEAAAVVITLPVLECGDREQGINTGYADYYGARLADQWIDITDVPYGDYQLQIIVDPHNLIEESNEDNNRLSMPLSYTSDSVQERPY
ncbi:MAG: lysyl oxidase family protein [Chloroflexota bacterium]